MQKRSAVKIFVTYHKEHFHISSAVAATDAHVWTTDEDYSRHTSTKLMQEVQEHIESHREAGEVYIRNSEWAKNKSKELFQQFREDLGIE